MHASSRFITPRFLQFTGKWAIPFSMLFFLTATFSAQTADTAQMVKIDQAPFFAGCENLTNQPQAKRLCSEEKLGKFIAEHLVYPDSAIEKGVEGKVIVSFIIDETGQPTDAVVVRDIGAGCGQAALAVVKAMPKWEPATHQGKKVKFKLTMPFGFMFKAQASGESQQFSIHWGAIRGDKVKKSTLLESLETQLYVRDAFGNAVQISELSFTFEKKRKTSEAKISGALLDKKMKKIVQKASTGGTFTISATIQQVGKFIVVEKSFSVEE